MKTFKSILFSPFFLAFFLILFSCDNDDDTSPGTEPPELTPTLATSSSEILSLAESVKEPIGIKALDIYEERKAQSFDDNVRYSNNWIQSQIDFYDSVSGENKGYSEYIEEMIEGGGPEKSLGMRGWLNDPDNVAFWDNAVQQSIGDDGYAMLISLNGAFQPEVSSQFRLIYGGTRLFHDQEDRLSINGSFFENIELTNKFGEFPDNPSNEDFFRVINGLSHKIRLQVFQLYTDYRNGNLSEETIRRFNRAYAVVGGCATANTDAADNLPKAQRYLSGLNFFAQELTEMGYTI
ncbi:hypothetical protein [Flavilitoribacter nigricans]|uniref:DUF4856 domain-containing protein n=1 Tax=Flavilitoribacter nigricans (strain ATCC 23147 / DSM 23189 / NBRC 102662 / NCIMB 1420 / SS-2) TaxID=1122177 RepID=A0A2D0N640_FLAN2|nr:hypothetical protein [Flavilitoribacter nigricans]PHN03965.1 hypothetical protein CRP01_24140 [Flavilitoribacter nigricans DSM 23189 = NBRC 102662]